MPKRRRTQASFQVTSNKMRFSEEEKRIFHSVVEWQAASAQTRWVLGEPLVKMLPNSSK